MKKKINQKNVWVRGEKNLINKKGCKSINILKIKSFLGRLKDLAYERVDIT